MSKQTSLIKKGLSALKLAAFGVAAFQTIRRWRAAYLAKSAAHVGTATAQDDGAATDKDNAPSARQEFLGTVMPPASPASRVGPSQRGGKVNFKPVMRGNRMIGKA